MIIYNSFVIHCIVFKKYFFKLIFDLFEKERGTCAVIPLDSTRNGSNGEITSPGYPRNYPENINYTWILETGHLNADVTFTILDSDSVNLSSIPVMITYRSEKRFLPVKIPCTQSMATTIQQM